MVYKKAGCFKDDAPDSIMHGQYALSYAYTFQLITHGLPMTSLLSRLAERKVVVTMGWSEGDVDPVGQFGWGPIRNITGA